MKKKMLAAIIAASMMVTMVTGCGDNRKTSDDTVNTEVASEESSEADASAEDSQVEEAADEEQEAEVTEEVTEETADEADAEASEEADAEASEEAKGEYVIGISQFAEHGSLDNCREGFIKGLENKGIKEGENLTIHFQNAQADTGTASQISDAFVADGVDLICGIATPSAMSAYNSALGTQVPVIYSAVSDPVAAELAKEDGTPVGNITGTSDALAVTQQLDMIRKMLPDAKKIGILFTTSETNSESTIAQYKEHAAEYGFEIVDSGINTLADLDMAAADLVTKVDCINNLTDNTVVSGLQTVLSYANEQGIPVFGSEVEQVKVGCVAAMGLDYMQLGIQTGEMAAKVLLGESKAEEMPFEVIDEPSLYVNTAAAEKISMTLDESLVSEAAEVYDTIADGTESDN
ncbi:MULTISPECIES: ABC transporter substrate-binding protein [unclassified Butyrivibrio]|uniref:ABC transporter substrate-binding protein n=1 Tax=unclassified Butyrivibrio TaxID=2639466 RepID=UPI0003F64AF8|nr:MULTISPECIES: ABC transporter substrate-binding protein [unclassified Butyrivibrio]